MATLYEKYGKATMRIGLSLETTLHLRNTWHAAINHEWYDFLKDHKIYPLIPYDVYDVREYDLIILCGGNDMQQFKTWRDNNDPIRDNFERDLLTDALSFNIPVAGICRGSAFINRFMGGTNKVMTEPYDGVIVDLQEFRVTANHTICVDKLASGFDILLQDDKGVVELFHNKDQRMLGIGWHPERSYNAHTRPYIINLLRRL